MKKWTIKAAHYTPWGRGLNEVSFFGSYGNTIHCVRLCNTSSGLCLDKKTHLGRTLTTSDKARLKEAIVAHLKTNRSVLQEIVKLAITDSCSRDMLTELNKYIKEG